MMGGYDLTGPALDAGIAHGAVSADACGDGTSPGKFRNVKVDEPVSSAPSSCGPTYGDRLFALRWTRLRLSQAAFAERYGLTLGAVKDLERGRYRAPRAVCLLIAAIEADPRRMADLAIRERGNMAAR